MIMCHYYLRNTICIFDSGLKRVLITGRSWERVENGLFSKANDEHSQTTIPRRYVRHHNDALTLEQKHTLQYDHNSVKSSTK